MPPKENPERACDECIHFFACSMQCGETMAQSSATGCDCYEPLKSSMAYYVGTLDGAKGEIPSRLRKLAEADMDGRCVVLPCKVGDVVYGFHGEYTILPMVAKWLETNYDGWSVAAQYVPMAPRFYRFSDFGKTVFLSFEEAERALREMEGKKDGKT